MFEFALQRSGASTLPLSALSRKREFLIEQKQEGFPGLDNES